MRSRLISSVIAMSCLALVMSGCGKNDESENWRLVSIYDTIEEEKGGMFVVDSTDRLDFLDFSSLESSAVCDKPECSHSSESDCSAYGKSNHPFIYNDSLYYLVKTDFFEEENKYYISTQLWKSDINGDNEKLLYEFEKFDVENYDKMMLCSDFIYFVASYQPYDEDMNELEPSYYLLSYSLADNEAENTTKLVSGYSCGAYIYGMWNGKIVLNTSTSKDNRPYMEKVMEYAQEHDISEEDAFSQFENEYINENLLFDPEKQQLEENELPQPLAVSEDFYYYQDNEAVEYINKDDEKLDTGVSGESLNVTALNGYALISADETNYLFNEADETLSTLNDSYSIVYITEDNEAIYESVNDVMGTTEYNKKSIDEMLNT
ncbi:MAG: hypothetical protein LUI06_09465 [Ruminococcus sp.]|nr:hypothetical protein [Ruminococcus sp.]